MASVICDLPKISLDYRDICGQGKIEMVSGAKDSDSRMLETTNASNAKLFNDAFTYPIQKIHSFYS